MFKENENYLNSKNKILIRTKCNVYLRLIRNLKRFLNDIFCLTKTDIIKFLKEDKF